MPDVHEGADDAGYEDLLGRISGGAGGISPRADASGVLRGALRRRRRRRAVLSGVTAAAVAVVVGVGGYLAVTHLPEGDPPAASNETPSAFVDGRYQPAEFFSEIVGGFAFPSTVTHHLTRGERFIARINWRPQPGVPQRIPVVISVETFTQTPLSTCDDLPVGGKACEAAADGAAVTSYSVPVAQAFDDPVHRAQASEVVVPGATVRGVTYLRSEGVAVSVQVCDCLSSRGGGEFDAPVTDEQLREVASSPTWRNDGDGGG